MPRGKPDAPLEERFLRRVNKTDTCWLWTGGKFLSGYGQLKQSEWGERYTHRWSYKHFTKNDIPDGYDLRHKCDTRLCVNPEHLEIGTRQQNVNDMKQRYIGKAFNKRFTQEEADAIREKRKEGIYYKDLAVMFNCSYDTIKQICLNRTYITEGCAKSYRLRVQQA